MNKKNLSVVMAGAMLATSVAPVLAEATKENTYEVALGNTGLLIDKLEPFFESKKYDKTDAKAGESVYELQRKVSTGWVEISLNALKTLANREPANYELRVVEKGYAEVDGKIFSKEPARYTSARFDEIVNNFNGTGDSTSPIAILKEKKVIEKIEKDEKTKTLTITLANNENFENKKLVLKENDFELNFKNPVDKDGNVIPMDNIGDGKAVKPADIVGFKTVDPSVEITEGKDLYYINLVKGDVKYTVNCDDLYDGLMLTEKGHSLLEAVNKLRAIDTDNVEIEKVTSKPEGSINSFKVTLTDENKNVTVITIRGTQTDRLEVLKDWLNRGVAKVDILSGSNRYATAVEIAKTYMNATKYQTGEVKVNQEIVLVNGEALVDGLAAAPYAKQQKAPILLTSANTLSKETKAYMKDLASDVQLGSLKDVTVTIIGGEAVVSDNVAEQIKDIGFKVKRISGDNREETSLAVANKLNPRFDRAFVVGAEGEADAMSIAPRAAAMGQPIIVSKSTKGLSTVGINELGDYENVTIIGGEGAVSKVDEDKIKELVKDEKKVTRIAGKNRFETNAMIIKEYHHDFNNVLVSNDGLKDKTKLVDALPVSVFASLGGSTTKGTVAPIVLASDNLTKEQLNQVVLHAKKNSKNVMEGTLYQVGGTIERSVMQTLANKLGLTK